MRFVRALVPLILTVVVLFILDRPLGALPALGRLLDPVNGWGANAEAKDMDYGGKLGLEGVEKEVHVWFEDRMVPHVLAASDGDLYFTQGYIHARFRLWQMDMQTRAAAGRISEVAGEKAVIFDRTQRRKGMVFAAEHSLKTMEEEPRTKAMLDAYTAGINNYIAGLAYKWLPLEYKLMGFTPEPWTNLKTALLLKYMADDLTGYTEDIPLTILKGQLSAEEFERFFPQRLKGSVPVVPSGTRFEQRSLPTVKAPGDSVWAHWSNPGMTAALAGAREEPGGIGSNNWALSGAHTKDSSVVLCNDPHLGLNLPSLWFEMQLQCPGMNVYGVSLPGAPGIVIGFNDSLSWGLTNNYRDVKDFYEIEAIDRDFYRFDGGQRNFVKKAEVIKVKGKADVIDTVYYTVHGPVTYDERFEDPSGSKKTLAVCWMAHRGTNELLSLYLLNRARNYIEFTEAILHFECPAQNIVYADRSGNIAIWGQGQFINKWKDQGRYVMKGNTSATLWGEDIPMTENPHVLNPPQGYLASANQVTTDSTYPYWYNGYFYDFRAWRINELLAGRDSTSAEQEEHLQTDVKSVLARNTLPLMLRAISGTPGQYVKDLEKWDFDLKAESGPAALYQIWWTMFYEKLWKDKTGKITGLLNPSPERTMQLLTEDSSFYPVVRATYQQAKDSFARHFTKDAFYAPWYQVKGTQLTHLAKIDAFSYKDIFAGGWGNVINAMKKTHGPSWRMIVEMGRKGITAYGVYPGGQSGNPGSRYYGNFINHWAGGRYYTISFLSAGQKPIPGSMKATWVLQPKK